MSVYKVSLCELCFFLWELFEVDKWFLVEYGLYGMYDCVLIDVLFECVCDFVFDFGCSYQQVDVEGCMLFDDGQVWILLYFYVLWVCFCDEWLNMLFGIVYGLLLIVMQMIYEMFMGVNLFFMIYGGFMCFVIKLLQMYGMLYQKVLIVLFEVYCWDVCFCVIELQVGIDFIVVVLCVILFECDVYVIDGEKVYILVGMYELMENMLYFVFGCIDIVLLDLFLLLCFVVLCFWLDDEIGELQLNYVDCIGLLCKMGLKGCVNMYLVFGVNGMMKGWLFGGWCNVGLLQLMLLMNQVWMSIGMFGVGVVLSVYLYVVEYVGCWLQGWLIECVLNINVVCVVIVEYVDVQCMLVDMKSCVDGCCGLFGKFVVIVMCVVMFEVMFDVDLVEIECYCKL